MAFSCQKSISNDDKHLFPAVPVHVKKVKVFTTFEIHSSFHFQDGPEKRKEGQERQRR